MDQGATENKKYDKIKHLVEVDDDIMAVFTMTSERLQEFYIAKNSKLTEVALGSLITTLNLDHYSDKYQNIRQDIGQLNNNYNLGKMKWIVIEYENLRILKLYEFDKTVFVLIKSKTQLQHTVDSILGYYYDLDDVPKVYFSINNHFKNLLPIYY